MNWLIDASAARHSGALTHHLGVLPALDGLLGPDRCRVLASPELARALDGRLQAMELVAVEARQGAARLAALNSVVRRHVTDLRPDAVLFGQYAPLRAGAPYVLRMTDAHLVDHQARRSVLRFYSAAQRMAWTVKLAAFRRSLRAAGAVLCATRAVRDQLLEAHPELDSARVQVAHYGVSPLAETGQRHDGPRGRRMLTMHLSPRKNVEQILDAMALPGMEAFELTVLGDLNRPRTRYTRFLAERVRSLGLGGRVHSAGYIAEPGRLLGVMLEHDVLLCPSRIESWSHTVVEAMALGMPVVASDIACHREVTGGAAWLVPIDSAAVLAEAVRTATVSGADADARRRLGLEVVRGYHWDGHATGVLRALRSAAA